MCIRDSSTSVPTTSCQHDLASVIYEELQEIGATNLYYDKDTCVVYGSLEANVKTGRAIGFVTYMDTCLLYTSPVEVTVGGATIFVLDVAQFLKV